MLALHMSAIGGKADMAVLHCKCPLMTQSGHQIHAVGLGLKFLALRPGLF